MNNYFESARNTGVVEIIPQNGCISGKVVVWLAPGLTYTFLPYGAIDAYWSGNRLIVVIEGETVRSYCSLNDYDIIR
jgi:hypothetical protein